MKTISFYINESAGNFKVFKINTYTQDNYGIDIVLIGANSAEEILKHAKNIKQLKGIKDLEASDFELVPNLFTDKPYVVLAEYQYFE